MAALKVRETQIIETTMICHGKWSAIIFKRHVICSLVGKYIPGRSIMGTVCAGLPKQ